LTVTVVSKVVSEISRQNSTSEDFY